MSSRTQVRWSRRSVAKLFLVFLGLGATVSAIGVYLIKHQQSTEGYFVLAEGFLVSVLSPAMTVAAIRSVESLRRGYIGLNGAMCLCSMIFESGWGIVRKFCNSSSSLKKILAKAT